MGCEPPVPLSRNTLSFHEARKVARNLRVGWVCTRVKLANDSASFRSRVGITPRRAGRRAHLSSSKGQTRREAGAQSHGPAVHPTIRAVGRLVAEGRAGENLSIPGATGNRRIVAPNSPVHPGVAGARSAISHSRPHAFSLYLQCLWRHADACSQWRLRVWSNRFAAPVAATPNASFAAGRSSIRTNPVRAVGCRSPAPPVRAPVLFRPKTANRAPA
jgi:hypothetical protein